MSGLCEHQILANKISRFIKTGIYKSGYRLPSEQDIARNFNVSRTCVRDAKIILEAQGLIERKGRLGTYVNNTCMSQHSFPLKVNPFELTQARALIEAEAAALAAPIITEATLTELEYYMNIIADKNASDISKNEAGIAFHRTIANVTNNQMIIFFVRSMWKAHEECEELQDLYRKIYNDNSGQQKHGRLKILEALRERSSDKSRMAMREYIGLILQLLIEASEKAELEEAKRKASAKRSRFLLASQLT